MTTIPTSPDRPRRADAVRNREAIVAAASAAMAEYGTSVDVREIARCSGVGMGTLYRHFPTKSDLVEAVLRQDFTRWAEAARHAAARATDPWAALTDFFEQALTGYARHRATLEHFALTWAEPDREGIGQLRLVIDELRARADAAGLLRPGVTTDDVLLLLVALGHAVEVSDACRPEGWRRLLTVTLDGLRADHPGDAVTPA